jgi:hypothetical protein
VRDSLSIVIAVAIASSSRILFSNPFMPLLMTTGSRLKCPAVALNGRLANSFPKYPTTALPNAPGRLRELLYNKSLDGINVAIFNPEVLSDPQLHCYFTYFFDPVSLNVKVERTIGRTWLNVDGRERYG